jgi:hypothetical protein
MLRASRIETPCGEDRLGAEGGAAARAGRDIQ